MAAALIVLAALAAQRAWAEPVAVQPVLPEAVGSGQQIQEVTDAVTRFRNGDVDGALALLNTAVKKHAELPPARLMLAQLFAAANQPAAVRDSIE